MAEKLGGVPVEDQRHIERKTAAPIRAIIAAPKFLADTIGALIGITFVLAAAAVICATVLLAAWAIVGTPSKHIANWAWPDDAAPWENVEFLWYPEKDVPWKQQREAGPFMDVAGCREYASRFLEAVADMGYEDSDYACGVGFIGKVGTYRTYRVQVK